MYTCKCIYPKGSVLSQSLKDYAVVYNKCFWESCVKNQIIHDCINLYAYIYIEFFPPLQISQTCSDNPCKNNATCQPGTGGQVCQLKACVTLKD